MGNKLFILCIIIKVKNSHTSLLNTLIEYMNKLKLLFKLPQTYSLHINLYFIIILKLLYNFTYFIY